MRNFELAIIPSRKPSAKVRSSIVPDEQDHGAAKVRTSGLRINSDFANYRMGLISECTLNYKGKNLVLTVLNNYYNHSRLAFA